MNDLSKTPAAELVGEYKKRQKAIYDSDSVDEWKASLQEIAEELDRRCEDAGINLEGDMFTFGKLDTKWSGRFSTKSCMYIHATELHALMGWMLTKDK